ncbi:MAG: Rpn family recombination-promoting nuclease/putative transposase [Candidatus Cryptobacteroides sp.]
MESNQKTVSEKKYVSLLIDVAFKIIYGDKANKSLLIDLLNVILPEEAQVSDITEYCDRELLRDTIFSKGTRLDLLCRGKDGSKFIVEVQREKCEPFFKRVMFYASIVYRNSLPESGDYDELTPVYVVGILNYKLGHPEEARWDSDHIISHYVMTEKRTGEFAPTVFSCNFVELSRFNKTADECTTYRDQLFYWFRHSDQLDRIPEFINPSPKMEQLAKVCEKASFTPEQKIEYERSAMNELDNLNRIYQAEKRGRAAGIAEGREEGREEGIQLKAIETARKMLAKGIDSNLVAECTGLPIETVNGL